MEDVTVVDVAWVTGLGAPDGPAAAADKGMEARPRSAIKM